MKTIRTILVAVMLFSATQAQAFVFDFSNINNVATGGGTYNASIFSFLGSADISQSLGADNILNAGDAFTISNITMRAFTYFDLNTNTPNKTLLFSDELTITGSATGHITGITATSVPYVYDTVNLSLKYDNLLTGAPIQTIATATSFLPNSSGGSLSDNVLGNQSTATYTITAPLTNIVPNWMFFNGIDATEFLGTIALTTGHISFLTSTVTPGNPIEIKNASIDGELKVATPEPASMILLGSGLIGLFAIRRRKNAN